MIVIGVGVILYEVLVVVESLKKDKISIWVLDFFIIKFLDRKFILDFV